MIGIFICMLLIGTAGSVYVLAKPNNPAKVQLINSQISIEKTVDFDGNGIYTDLETNTIGTTAYWKIVVTNIGNDTVYDINVTDTNGEIFEPFYLKTGEHIEFVYPKVITGDTFNVAYAKGVDIYCCPVGPVNDSAEVTVISEQGCTLTWGYWKTHSLYGPAPYDDTWALLDSNDDGIHTGTNEPFFGTGHTYMDILNMSCAGGNAYIILAHQYVAARLNGLKEDNPLLPGFIGDNMSNAKTLLTQYQGTMYISNRNSVDRVYRVQAIIISCILGNFNEGRYLNWPHCD